MSSTTSFDGPAWFLVASAGFVMPFVFAENKFPVIYR
jgi:hypothetical protein